MKTIFITISEYSTVKNVLRTDFLSELKNSTFDTKIVLIFDEKEKDIYKKEFSDDVIFEYIRLHKQSFYEKIIAFIARNGLKTGVSEIMQRRSYLSGESKIHPLFKKGFGILGSFRLFQQIIRILDSKISTQDDVLELFNRYNPDFVFSTTILNEMIDLPFLREAKKRGIYTIAMTRSWDNLTGYGFLRVLPNKFLAQNVFLKEMVVNFHFMPENEIEIFGLPHYDFYKKRDLIETRETYFKRMGLDLNKKLILYAAIGNFLFPHEGEIADVFEELISNNKIFEPTQVIFRAHPAFYSPLEDIQYLKHVIPDKNSFYLDRKIKELKVSNLETKHLINSLYHADILITAGSTMMIDGICFDKPVITIAFDGKSNESFWFSVKRFHDKANHIVDLLKTGGVRTVYNKKELADNINRYLKDPSLDFEGRKKVIKRFVDPLDGMSGKRLGKILFKEVVFK